MSVKVLEGEKIRILHILNGWGSGGVETNLLNYCDVFNKAGIIVDVFPRIKIDSLYDKSFLRYGGNIIEPVNIKKFPFRQFKKIKQLLNTIKEKNYPIIHVNGGTGDSLIYAWLIKKKFSDKKVIIHCHADNCPQNASFLFKCVNIIGKKFFKNDLDYYVACSDAAAKWLFDKKICMSQNFDILKYSIDVARYHFDNDKREYWRDKLDLKEKHVVGTIGRFSYQKNPEFIVRIMKEICEKDPDAMLLWIGEGELLNACKDMALQLAIQDKIIFYGVSKDIPELLAVMDVFLFPSRYEGLGIVLIEAQASGLECVIANRIPEEVNVTKLVHRLPLDAPEAIWATEVLKYIKNHDRKNMDYMIEKAGFDKNKNAEKMLKIYNDLLRR